MAIMIEIAGELKILPPELLQTKEVAGFVEVLGQKAGMDPPSAMRYTESLIVAVLGELGTRYVKAMREHFDGIVKIRNELKANYQEVARLGRSGALKNLPEGLDPAQFKARYEALVDHLEAIEKFEDFATRQKKESVSLTDFQEKTLAAEEALADDKPTGPDPDLKLNRRGSAPGEPPRKLTAEEQELADYKANLRDVGEDGAARLLATRLAERIRIKFLNDGRFRVSVRRIPGYGATRAQIEGLRPFDPTLAGMGYEMVIEFNGKEFAPDGLELNGDRFRFLEWKEPGGPHPEGYYSTPAGRARLREVMIERARLASGIDGCDGWWYESGQKWMNEAVADIVGPRDLVARPLEAGEVLPIANDADPEIADLAKWIKFPPRGTVVKR